MGGNMAIKVTCVNGHVLKAPENLVGKKVKCPKCDVVVLVLPPSSVDSPLALAQQTGTGGGANDPFGGSENHDPFGSMDTGYIPPASPQGYAPSWPPVTSSQNPAPPENVVKSGINPALIYSAVAGVAFFGLVIFGGALLWIASSFKTNNPNGKGSAGPGLIGDSLIGPMPSGGVENVAGGADKTIEQWLQPSQKEKKVVVKTDIDDSFYATQRSASKSFIDIANPFVIAQKENPKIPASLDWNSENIRTNWVPFFQMTSSDEELAMRKGITNDGVKKRIELLLEGSKALGLDGWGDNPKGLTGDALSDRYYADMLAFKWRFDLYHKPPTLDKEKCKLIRKIEDSCFGEDSAFHEEDAFLKDSETFAKISNKLATVYLGVSSFKDSFRGLLPSPSGSPRLKGDNLSWRVAILPFIEQQELFQQFHLDEPWDSEHNAKLVELMPECFDVCGPHSKGYTTVHLPLHANGLCFNGRDSMRPKTGTADYSVKIVFLVGGKETAEPWTKPGGVEFLPEDGSTQLGTPYMSCGYIYMTFDGRNRLLTNGLSAEDLRYSLFVDTNTDDWDRLGKKFPFAHEFGVRTHKYNMYILSLIRESENKKL
jgi:hypothetical protein